MKSKPRSFTILFATTLMVNAQVVDDPVSPFAGRTPDPPFTARILGEIPDGSPPPPAPMKPGYQVAAKDTLSTATHRQAGRTITIRQITPIDLPQPPAPLAPVSGEKDAEFRRQADGYREEHAKTGVMFLGATVYRAEGSPPRTLVRYWPEGGKEFTFWTAVDYSLIAGGINSFVDDAGETHHLVIGWSNVDLDRKTDLPGQETAGIDILELLDPAALADGVAGLHIVGQPPSTADLAPLQALHNLYNQELPRLRTAYQGRERARTEREEYLKANPPQPRDITLNFWRTEKPAAGGNGGSK